MCLSGNASECDRNHSKTFPNWVLIETQMHLIEILLRKCQIVTHLKFNCLSSKLLEDKSLFRRSWTSISSHQSCSKTFPNCVLVESQSHLIGITLKQFQNMSEPKFNCISSKFFYDSSILRLSRNSIASDRTYSTTKWKSVIVEIHLHLIEIILRQFRIVS